MRVMAVLLSLLGTPLAASEWMLGPWCDETGWDVITFAPNAVFLTPQTACPLADPLPEDGALTVELQCETTLFHGAEAGDLQHIDVLVRLEVQPTGDGGLAVGFDGRAPEHLRHCHEVWPL